MKVRKVHRGGKEVWEVDLPASKVGAKRTRFFAATREQAVTKATEFIERKDLEGAFGKLSPDVFAVASRWSAEGRLKAEEIDQACREYSARKGLNATAADAVDDYLTAPREVPLSKVHLGPLRTRLNAFVNEFGPRQLVTITPGELGDFCKTQGRSSPNYYSALRALFTYAHSRDWVASNPFERIARPQLEPAERGLLTPDQMKKMLRVAAGLEGIRRSEGLLRLLVLGGFCGLRHSECLRQPCEGIDRKTWEIHVARMKTAKRGMRERYAQTEANAQAWLSWLALPETGRVVTLTDSNVRIHRLEAAHLAGMEGWPDNALRRSFASYHLASFGNAARTAEILGHTDAETTQSKYRVARKKEVADAWFALTPAAVLA